MPQTRRLALILQQSSSGNRRPQPNNGNCHRTPPLHSATRPASSTTSHRPCPSPTGRSRGTGGRGPALLTNFTPGQERHGYHATPIPRIISDLESSSARLYAGSKMVEAEAHAQAFTTASPNAPPSKQHLAITGATSGIATRSVTWQHGTMLPFGRSDVHTTPPSIIHPLLTTSVFTSTVE